MEEVRTIVIFFLVAVTLLVIARYSRKKFETKHGKPTKNERLQFVYLIFGWLGLFALVMWLFPVIFGWFYGIMLFFGAPVIWTKQGHTLARRTQESALLAIVFMLPIAYIYYIR